MTGEVWLSYRLSDFVMFSERVYQRQIQLYNENWLGLQVVALILAGVIFWHMLKPSGRSGRVIPILLALAWFWVGWSFLWARYAEINLLALYAAPAFALQGLALLVIAGLPGGLRVKLPRDPLRLPAITLLFFALFLYPLIALLAGEPVMSAEFFALMPDPTAVATLAVVSMCAGPMRWLLMLVPLAWCLCSAAVLWVLESAQFWPLALLVAVAVLLAAIRPKPSSDRADDRDGLSQS
ncbi:DUF6064 family protein [Hoeflea sp.]|uniref:DUF6064 family protein n=1 Tax=Hoeflea sp. TaxID=1940281 RepID=UPI003B023935